jgi:hypothetical protein
MSKMSASSFAEEAAESIINGNMSHVIEQLDKLPKKQGLAAVAYICNYLQNDDYQCSAFRRRLTDRL